MSNLQFLFAGKNEQPFKNSKILDGKVTVFKRPSSKVWQCRFKLSNGVWHTTTTGTDDLAEARRQAVAIYETTKIKLDAGLAVSSRTFKQLALEELANMTRALSKRHSLVLERAMFNGKNGFKKEQLWKLLKSSEYPSSRSKEVRLNSKKTANNHEARTYLSILASKNIKQAFYIAENAARGKFPCQEPITTGLKFDFEKINAVANAYTKKAMELAIQAEKINQDYMKIISPTSSYKKMKKIDVGEMLEK